MHGARRPEPYRSILVDRGRDRPSLHRAVGLFRRLRDGADRGFARAHACARKAAATAARPLVNLAAARRDRLIGAMLLGNTIVNIGASAFTTSILVSPRRRHGRDLRDRPDDACCCSSSPKSCRRRWRSIIPTACLARRRAHRRLLRRDLRPGARRRRGFVRGYHAALRPQGRRAIRSLLSGHEELKSAVDLLHRGRRRRALRPRHVRRRARPATNSTVSDVMVHRTNMLTIDADLPPEEIMREVVAVALYAPAALARRAGKHHRRAARQGSAARARRRRAARPRTSKSRASRWSPGSCPTRRPCRISSQAFLQAQDAFRPRRRRIRRRAWASSRSRIFSRRSSATSRDEHDLVVQGVRPPAGRLGAPSTARCRSAI